MVNKNYRSGRSREYRTMNKLKEEGMIVLRTAGSHGFCDLICLDPVTRIITFIQVKPTSMGIKAKQALGSTINYLEGDWRAKTCVVSLAEEIK